MEDREQLFYKRRISRKLRNWIRAGAGYAYLTAVGTMLLSPMLVLDALFSLGIGIGIHLFRNRACSVILLVYFWINRLIIWTAAGPDLLSVVIVLVVTALLVINIRAVFLYREKLKRYLEYTKQKEREEKHRLRKELKAAIRELPDSYCKEADARIGARLYELDVYQQAKVVFGYVGTSGEIDTMPILLRALSDGKQVGIPLCTENGIMEVHRIAGCDSLEPGFYGIMEPKPECPVIRPEEIDLILVPCLSCTEEGVRLGYGGGYYDRYLPHAAGFKLALCRDRLLREELPIEAHDIPVDGVLTEYSTKILNHIEVI